MSLFSEHVGPVLPWSEERSRIKNLMQCCYIKLAKAMKWFLIENWNISGKIMRELTRTREKEIADLGTCPSHDLYSAIGIYLLLSEKRLLLDTLRVEFSFSDVRRQSRCFHYESKEHRKPVNKRIHRHACSFESCRALSVRRAGMNYVVKSFATFDREVNDSSGHYHAFVLC